MQPPSSGSQPAQESVQVEHTDFIFTAVAEGVTALVILILIAGVLVGWWWRRRRARRNGTR